MALDPIVSLAVAVAEAPGTCAFFLGSGVSRDAGIPTGWEVMREGLRRLHRLETDPTQAASEAELDQWLVDTGHSDITYSELLELITPDQAVRREYLAAMFEGKEPGRAHHALAALAERHLVRVFITTNFDRLLEHALQARGIEPIVIASDADLEVGIPREHASCVVVKPHGDYLRQTIRNTTEEISTLEPGMAAELSEIFNRFGLVVLGYSGSDPAISTVLRTRRSRYGLWWVTRSELREPAAGLVNATAGRVVRRESASEFLSDLERRLLAFQEHPTGLTPPVVHDATRSLIRAGDMVGLGEDQRFEQNRFAAELDRVSAEFRPRHPNEEGVMREAWNALRPVLERRLASLLPLFLHDSERADAAVSGLARMLERAPLADGYTIWAELKQLSVTWLGYVVAAVMMRLEQYEALAPLVGATWTTRYDSPQPLVWLPGETQHALGEALAPPGQRWISPGWEFLTNSLAGMDWLLERYPELAADQEPRSSMSQFDMILCIRAGVLSQRTFGFFRIGREGASDLARRMHRDESLRARIASLVGLTLEAFDESAPSHLRAAHQSQGTFAHSDVANLLEHGVSDV